RHTRSKRDWSSDVCSSDLIVIRHSSSGSPYTLTKWVKGSVLNAGDGTHEHPTQALLDLYTIRERLGRFEGLRAAIIGDVMHSREIGRASCREREESSVARG